MPQRPRRAKVIFERTYEWADGNVPIRVRAFLPRRLEAEKYHCDFTITSRIRKVCTKGTARGIDSFDAVSGAITQITLELRRHRGNVLHYGQPSLGLPLLPLPAIRPDLEGSVEDLLERLSLDLSTVLHRAARPLPDMQRTEGNGEEGRSTMGTERAAKVSTGASVPLSRNPRALSTRAKAKAAQPGSKTAKKR